jgi:hypothetical protein
MLWAPLRSPRTLSEPTFAVNGEESAPVRVRRRNEIDLGPRLPTGRRRLRSKLHLCKIKRRPPLVDVFGALALRTRPSPRHAITLNQGDHSATDWHRRGQAGAPPRSAEPSRGPSHRRPALRACAGPLVRRRILPERSPRSGCEKPLHHSEPLPPTLRGAHREQHRHRQRDRTPTLNTVQARAFIELCVTPQALVVHHWCHKHSWCTTGARPSFAHARIPFAYQRSSSF